MGTAAWGGSGEGKCFPCHGLSWWRLLLYFPSQPRKTAVRPKLSAVSVIRLFVRTRQPSATLASPLVCMRETTSLALRSVLHKETSRWSAATTPQEPRVRAANAGWKEPNGLSEEKIPRVENILGWSRSTLA